MGSRGLNFPKGSIFPKKIGSQGYDLLRLRDILPLIYSCILIFSSGPKKALYIVDKTGSTRSHLTKSQVRDLLY